MRCHPDDGGSKDIWNVGKLLPDYMAPQLRRQPSSYSLPWEPQVLLMYMSNFLKTNFMFFSHRLLVDKRNYSCLIQNSRVGDHHPILLLWIFLIETQWDSSKDTLFSQLSNADLSGCVTIIWMCEVLMMQKLWFVVFWVVIPCKLAGGYHNSEDHVQHIHQHRDLMSQWINCPMWWKHFETPIYTLFLPSQNLGEVFTPSASSHV
jgi:hypothetical protein